VANPRNEKKEDGVQNKGWEAVQIGVHLLERVLGLREKVVDYTLAKFTLVLVIVHFKDLFKCRRINIVPEIQEYGRAVFGLHVLGLPDGRHGG
jgi:hypothetical protein